MIAKNDTEALCYAVEKQTADVKDITDEEKETLKLKISGLRELITKGRILHSFRV